MPPRSCAAWARGRRIPAIPAARAATLGSDLEGHPTPRFRLWMCDRIARAGHLCRRRYRAERATHSIGLSHLRRPRRW
jgi:hypothetical protein